MQGVGLMLGLGSGWHGPVGAARLCCLGFAADPLTLNPKNLACSNGHSCSEAGLEGLTWTGGTPHGGVSKPEHLRRTCHAWPHSAPGMLSCPACSAATQGVTLASSAQFGTRLTAKLALQAQQ